MASLLKNAVVRAGSRHASYALRAARNITCSSLNFSSDTKDKAVATFDTKMLEILVCPLSKKPLRYDEENNELICDDLGVAYPIVDKIPYLNPQDGRMIKNKQDSCSNNSADS